jgi:hypothetical protein
VITDNNNNCDITEFYSVLGTNYLETCIVDEATTLYVCGYASNSVYKKIDCTFCQCSIREAKGDEVGCPYFDSLQRGGLSLPTEFVITIFFHMNAIHSLFLMKTKQTIVIYTTREEGKAFVHANCMFGHDAQRSGRCNSSEQKRPYSRVLYLILFDTRHNSLENESVTLY